MINCAVHATVLFSRRESRAVGEDPAPLLGGTPYTHVQRAKLIITHPQKFVTSTTSIMMEGNQTICRLLKTFVRHGHAERKPARAGERLLGHCIALVC